MTKLMNTDITEIQISVIKPINGLVAFANLVLNNQFYLSSIGIHKKLQDDQYRLTYPTKILGDTRINIFHPINKTTSLAIEKAVICKFKEVMNKSNDRHYSFDAQR